MAAPKKQGRKERGKVYGSFPLLFFYPAKGQGRRFFKKSIKSEF